MLSAARSVESVGDALPDQPETVLVAEDEHLVAVELVEQLRRLNMKVIGPASNGHEAVELAKVHQPHIALVDLKMPQVDGLDAIGILTAQLRVPVIVVSAYSSAPYVEQTSRLGVYGYLLKPVSEDDLRVTLAIAWSRHLDHVHQRDQIRELRTTLEERKIIEQAKGLLMLRLNLSEPEALNRLRRHARSSRRKLVDMARAVIEANELLDP